MHGLFTRPTPDTASVPDQRSAATAFDAPPLEKIDVATLKRFTRQYFDEAGVRRDGCGHHVCVMHEGGLYSIIGLRRIRGQLERYRAVLTAGERSGDRVIILPLGHPPARSYYS